MDLRAPKSTVTQLVHCTTKWQSVSDYWTLQINGPTDCQPVIVVWAVCWT